MAVVSIIAVLQIWGTQKLKEEGSKAIFHPSVICYSYYICWITLQGSFLIRRGCANLPLTPISLQTLTQYAIYSLIYNHSWNYHRAFLGISSSEFLQAPDGLSLAHPKEDTSIRQRMNPVLHWRHCTILSSPNLCWWWGGSVPNTLGNRFHLPRESILAVGNNSTGGKKSSNSSSFSLVFSRKILENKKIAQCLRQWMILPKHVSVALKFNFTSWGKQAFRFGLAKIKPAGRFVYQLPMAVTCMVINSVAQKDFLKVINKYSGLAVLAFRYLLL